MMALDPIAEHLLSLIPPIDEQAIASAHDQAKQAANHEENVPWEEPVPLPATRNCVGFCPEVLGALASEFVKAVATETATPVDFAALAALGVTSAIIAGAAVVEPQSGWREPVNLYLIGLAAPGEGKTPVLAKVAGPLDVVEHDRQLSIEPDRIQAESRLKIAEARLKKLQDAAAKKDGAERTEAEVVVIRAAAEAADAVTDVPAFPRIYTREATPEALVGLLGSQHGRMSVITDEGAEFFQLASRYSGNGKGNLGIYVDGWDGKRHVTDRVGRPPIVIERTTLTVMLFSQPIILADLGRDPQMSGRGVTARFLWALPSSMVGYRPIIRESVSSDLMLQWELLILQLAYEAQETKEPISLGLAPDAAALWNSWRKELEPRLRPDEGDLARVAEWASKLPGQVLRLAGNLHALRTGHLGGSIDESTMQGALMLATYFIDHVQVAFAKMSSDPRLDDAALVLRWLKGHSAPKFTTRELARSKEWPAKRVRTALELLVEHGWVRPVERERSVGRPSEQWERNPQVSGQNLTEVDQDVISSGFVRLIDDPDSGTVPDPNGPASAENQ